VRSKNRSTNRPKRKSEERDFLLILILAFFNVASGYTTITGANTILNNFGLAFFLGGFIQLGLFLMLSDFVMKRAPLRKWLAVIVFTFVSVYTSFFTYYISLAAKSDQNMAFDKAEKAHQKLFADVYTPMKERLRKLQEEAATLERKADQEREIGINTGLTGDGPEYRNLIKQKLDKEEEGNKLKAVVREVEAKINYPLKTVNPQTNQEKKLAPEEILEKDRQALAEVPEEWRKNYPELDRSLYVDTEKDIPLLAPYLKVKSQNEDEQRPAIISLAIALLVDGLSIMLGTAITIKRQRTSIFVSIAKYTSEYITNFKNSIAIIKNAGQQPGTALQREELEEIIEELRDTIQDIISSLEGEGTKFLNDFYNSIEHNEPYVINQKFWQANSNQPYKRGFRILTDNLKRVKWIQVNKSNNLEVKKEHYHNLMDLLTSEINYFEQEGKNHTNYNLYKFKNSNKNQE
jgi:hypothetical protein